MRMMQSIALSLWPTSVPTRVTMTRSESSDRWEGDEVKSDEIVLHPGDGEEWLQQRHGEWTAAGYQVTTED
jgi:hypothetical protein